MSRPSTRSTRDSTSCSPLNSRLKEETLLSKQLDVSIKADFEKNRRKMIRRVLILGSGDSGKTTVLKQMRLLHGANGGFDDSYRLSFKEIIRSNCLVSFRALVAGFLLLSTRSGEQDNDLQVSTIGDGC